MPSINPSTFRFLQDLKENNNREWFNEHKDLYKEAHQDFTDFVDLLIRRIAKFDPSVAHHRAKDFVFRIYRDIRFSKDKTPYKTHFGAHISSAAKRSDVHSRAGYYIHLSPGDSMLAGGAYMPQKDWLKAIRQEIAYNADEFRAILADPTFQRYFGEMEGEQLKTKPRDYPKDHPEIDLLRYKSFLATHRCPDEDVLDDSFLDHSAEVFKALYPFDRFLNRSTE